MSKKQDNHGNTIAREGVDRCLCGCKYWENDRCVDCGGHVKDLLALRAAVRERGWAYWLGWTAAQICLVVYYSPLGERLRRTI